MKKKLTITLTKQAKEELSKLKKLSNKFSLVRSETIYMTAAVLAGVLAVTESAYAVIFDFPAAANGFFTPILQVINDNWGKAIVVVGAIGMLVKGEGDLLTRAKGFALGAGGAGLVIAAVKLGFGV